MPTVFLVIPCYNKKTNITQDGEIAQKKVLSLNTDTIQKEEKFDGFYGVCTNLYTGKMKLVDTAGRVDKFMSRYAKRYDKKNAK